jgi:hypothetical protein
MRDEANHTPSPDGTASLLLAALEQVWTTIRRRHPDVPEAVLVVASGSEGKRLNWGHFAPHRWQVNGADRHEVLVGGEGLQRGSTEVLGTLLHEAPTASPQPAASKTPAAVAATTTAATPPWPANSAWTSPRSSRSAGRPPPSPTPPPPPTRGSSRSSKPRWCCGAATSTASAPAPAPATCSPPSAPVGAASAPPRRPWPRRRSSAAPARNRSSRKNQKIDA